MVSVQEVQAVKSVYLAGPILHQENYGQQWREWLKQSYDLPGIDWVDPMDSVEENTDAPVTEWDVEAIVESDLDEIWESDGMLVNWDAVPTAGTPMEIFYAKSACQIPVVVRTDLGPEAISPWITYYADEIVRDWPEAIDTLEYLLHDRTDTR